MRRIFNIAATLCAAMGLLSVSPARAASATPNAADSSRAIVTAVTSTESNKPQALSRQDHPTGPMSAGIWKRLQSAATGRYVAVISHSGRIVQEPRKVTAGTSGRFILADNGIIIAKNQWFGLRGGAPWRVNHSGPTGDLIVHFFSFHGRAACLIGFRSHDATLTAGTGRLLYLRYAPRSGIRSVFYVLNP